MAVPDRTEPAGRGGPGPDPEAPGWYRDPDLAGQLRYWDGTTWTAKRRPTPIWTGGPAVAGGDPVIGGDLVRGGDLAPVAPVAPRQQLPPGNGTADPTRPSPPGHDSGPGGDRPRRGSPRRKWLVLVVVAVAGATAVGIAGEALRPKSPGPRVLTDARYVRMANADCVRKLADLRPQDSGPFGQAIPPAQTAAQIDRAAAGLDSLSARLRALPASAPDRPHIAAWLDGWQRYIGLGRQYALFLRQHGNDNPGSLLVNSVHEASVADNFALANGLGSCTLFATPQPDPSNGF